MRPFSTVRRLTYDYNRRVILEMGMDIDDWSKNPYTAFKSRVYIELSAIVVFLLQYTAVHPNQVTMVYAFAGILGGVLLSTKSDAAVITALLIFVFKGVVDWSDGVLARLTDRCSDEGAVLDSWGAVVNSFGFLIGVGFYIFNRTNDITYIYLMALMIFLRGIDLREFAYRSAMSDLVKRRAAEPPKGVGSYSNSTGAAIIGFDPDGRAAWFRRIVMNTLDDRARSVDFVCLVILMEVVGGKLLISHLIYWAYLIRYVLIFGGGIYVVYFRQVPSQLKHVAFGEEKREVRGVRDRVVDDPQSGEKAT